MPTLARFYGIIIRMYFKEHNPPHIHAIYGGEEFSITIKDFQIIEGEKHPTPRVLAMVKEWISLNENQLLEMWNTQKFRKLEPLK